MWSEIWTTVRQTYHIDRFGLITNPGKFERELLLVPFFWEVVLNGFEDDSYNDGDIEYACFNLENWSQAVPELEPFIRESDCEYVVLWENSSGFVNSQWMTEQEYERWVEEIESLSAEEEDYDE